MEEEWADSRTEKFLHPENIPCTPIRSFQRTGTLSSRPPASTTRALCPAICAISMILLVAPTTPTPAPAVPPGHSSKRQGCALCAVRCRRASPGYAACGPCTRLELAPPLELRLRLPRSEQARISAAESLPLSRPSPMNKSSCRRSPTPLHGRVRVGWWLLQIKRSGMAARSAASSRNSHASSSPRAARGVHVRTSPIYNR